MTAGWHRAPGIALVAGDLLALRQGRGDGPRPPARRAGALASRRPGSGMDLREIRAYVPGDDPRRLDPWATARTGAPQVRVLHEDRDDATVLIADFRAMMLWGTGDALRSVRAARHLATIGWRAVARQGAVGLVLADPAGVRALAPAAGEGAMAAICALLASRHAEALTDAAGQGGTQGGTLAEALAMALRTAPAGAPVVLATAPDGWRGAEAILGRLARGRRLEVAVMMDPLEMAPPAAAVPVDQGGVVRMARLLAFDPVECCADLAALGAVPRVVTP